MLDRDIRKSLKNVRFREHFDDPDTIVVDELGLRHGISRVDIAVVNGFLHGYEIKSDSDTLQRLSNQVSIYSKVLDYATIVVGEKHASKAREQVPGWWGIQVVYLTESGTLEFKDDRSHWENPEIDPVALAELLWRPEVVEILKARDVSGKTLRKPRAYLYRFLSEMVTLKELRDLVRQQLKIREGWRGLKPPLSDADLSIPIPTS